MWENTVCNPIWVFFPFIQVVIFLKATKELKNDSLFFPKNDWSFEYQKGFDLQNSCIRFSIMKMIYLVFSKYPPKNHNVRKLPKKVSFYFSWPICKKLSGNTFWHIMKLWMKIFSANFQTQKKPSVPKKDEQITQYCIFSKSMHFCNLSEAMYLHFHLVVLLYFPS